MISFKTNYKKQKTLGDTENRWDLAQLTCYLLLEIAENSDKIKETNTRQQQEASGTV